MCSFDDLDVNFAEVFGDDILPKIDTLVQQEVPKPASDINTPKIAFRSPTRVTKYASILTSTPNPVKASRAQSPHERALLADRTGPLREPLSRSSNKHCVVRKFPGPAGLLPDKLPRSFDDPSLDILKCEDEAGGKQTDTILCSQASESAFSEPPFKRLKKDLNIGARDCPLNDYTVEWVKKKVVTRVLQGRKIPFLAVVLQSVDCSSADPVLSLRDPTGELSGTLHRDVWRDMRERLRPGAAIVLRQVGVISTGVFRRKVLLNITMNNIVTVYSPSDDGEVVVSAVHPTTTADLVKSIADWHTHILNSPARPPDVFPSPGSNQELFQSVASNSPAPNKGRPNLVNSNKVNRPFNMVSPAATKPPQTDKVIRDFGFLSEADIADLENAIGSQAEQKTPKSADENNSLRSNFDFFDDIQFEDALVSQLEDAAKSSATFVPKRSPARKTEPFRTPQPRQSKSRFEICSQTTLSAAETSQIDDVLSGVDLDDFEL